MKKQGLSGEDIQAMVKDPENAPLSDKERAMLAFVIKAVKSSDSISQADMDRLHVVGWSDQDVLEAMMHACNMVTGSILLKTFKLDTTC